MWGGLGQGRPLAGGGRPAVLVGDGKFNHRVGGSTTEATVNKWMNGLLENFALFFAKTNELK